MKFSLSWLKDHLDTDADAAAVAEKLTSIGLEVEGVDNPAEALAPFRIARVLTAERHPQADKLQVLTVDAGDGEPLQVVCGAPNARAGMLGVFGGAGDLCPGQRHDAQEGRDPRGRIERHDVLGARAGAGRRS